MQETPLQSNLYNSVGQSVFAGARNWFDIAALCFQSIRQVFNSETRLISVFFDEGEIELATNPNLKMLEDLSENVYQLVKRYGASYTFEDPTRVIQALQNLIASLDFQTWKDAKECAATPFFAIIKGIDLACQDDTRLLKKSKAGPLNSSAKPDIGVYVYKRNSYVGKILGERGILPVPEERINDQLKCLMFYRNTSDSMALPCIIRIDCKPGIVMPSSTTPLVIGIAPFLCKELVGQSEDSPISIVNEGGSSFGVKYCSSYSDAFQEATRFAVREAIKSHCHLLVFPELTITKELQNTISEELLLGYKSSSLLLVVAGSRYEDGNNVCHLLDGTGNEVGTYHKRSPYIMKDGERKMVESLERPGESCVLVDIPEFGLVLPSICKDLASDEEHTILLARDFRPTIVCCSAMSPSVERGFAKSLEKLAERSLSIACVSNLCGAREVFDQSGTVVSRVIAPGYVVEEGNTVSYSRRPELALCDLNKTPQCVKECSETGACLFVVEVDYHCGDFGGCLEEVSPTLRIIKNVQSNN